MKALKNKKGFIIIDRNLLDTIDFESIKLFFSNFFPVSIDSTNLYVSGQLFYYGYSEHFEEVDEEISIGYEYEVVIKGNKEIKFTRVKK